MQEKTDLRVYKTKKALMQSMMKLLNKKDFKHITVKELCDEALIRRATFYLHFEDKYDLLKYVIRSDFADFPAYKQLLQTGHSQQIRTEITKDAIDYLYENKNVVKSLINSGEIFTFTDIMSEMLIKDIDRLSLKDNTLSKLKTRFYTSGLLNAFVWLMQEKPELTKEDFLDYIYLINKSDY